MLLVGLLFLLWQRLRPAEPPSHTPDDDAPPGNSA
jgi:hypothetical protein